MCVKFEAHRRREGHKLDCPVSPVTVFLLLIRINININICGAKEREGIGVESNRERDLIRNKQAGERPINL